MFFINLETNRLILKNIGTDDRDFIFGLFSNDDVNNFLYDAEPLTNISGADEIINFYLELEPRNQHRWIIIRKMDNIKMGTCGFHCWNKNNSKVEMGYDLHKEFWGNGYMQEALIEIMTFAEKIMSINEIEVHIYVDNEKSIRLIERLDFKITGVKNYQFRSNEYPHKIYTLFLKK